MKTETTGRTWAEPVDGGPRRDLTFDEHRGFWTWAMVEVLRHTGIRIEELTELSHHSLIQYRLPDTGQLIPLLQITNEDETRQLKRLEQVRQSRDQVAVDAALRRIESEAADPEINLMPGLIDAVNVYATLGEVMASLGTVFGRHVEVPII